MSIETSGSVTGNTYTAGSAYPGGYTVAEYSTPTPSPVPTATPVPTPTPVPTVSPTPQMYTVYDGTYFVPSFSGTATFLTNMPSFLTSPTTGCFTMVLTQPVGGTAGQIRRAVGTPTIDDAFGFGQPQFTNGAYETDFTDGTLSAFTISNLTLTSGTGAFTLSNGVQGTVSIVGSESVIFSGSRRVQDAYHKYYMLLKSAEWYRTHARRR